jgi:hypothetical protein
MSLYIYRGEPLSYFSASCSLAICSVCHHRRTQHQDLPRRRHSMHGTRRCAACNADRAEATLDMSARSVQRAEYSFDTQNLNVELCAEDQAAAHAPSARRPARSRKLGRFRPSWPIRWAIARNVPGRQPTWPCTQRMGPSAETLLHAEKSPRKVRVGKRVGIERL